MAIVLNRTSVADRSLSAVQAGLFSARSESSSSHTSDALGRIGVRVRFAKQETIFNDGDRADHAYKVISGTVRLCKHTQDGRRQIADFLLAGDVFGGFSGVDEHSCTAEAVSDVVLMSYPKLQLDRLGNSTPGLSGYLISVLSKKLLKTREHLVVLGRQTAKERVASFLLNLAERAEVESGDSLDLPMGRQDIADHLGLTIETVCRVITDLKRSGIVAIPHQNQLLLNSIAALRAIVSSEA